MVNRDGVGWEAIEVSMCLGIGVGAQRGMGGGGRMSTRSLVSSSSPSAVVVEEIGDSKMPC